MTKDSKVTWFHLMNIYTNNTAYFTKFCKCQESLFELIKLKSLQKCLFEYVNICNLYEKIKTENDMPTKINDIFVWVGHLV